LQILIFALPVGEGTLTIYPSKLGPKISVLALGCTCTQCTPWLRLRAWLIDDSTNFHGPFL